MSVVLSKNFELYIINECEGYQFRRPRVFHGNTYCLALRVFFCISYETQFKKELVYSHIYGCSSVFVTKPNLKRNSYIATSLAHDVSEFCVAQGSSGNLCSLDVEAAFDGIPFSVLFNCANKILPDICWRLLYGWYKKNCMCMCVGKTSSVLQLPFKEEPGKATSPLLFNVFYQELIDKLSKVKSVIMIGARTYNVFAYADDLLLLQIRPTTVYRFPVSVRMVYLPTLEATCIPRQYVLSCSTGVLLYLLRNPI